VACGHNNHPAYPRRRAKAIPGRAAPRDLQSPSCRSTPTALAHNLAAIAPGDLETVFPDQLRLGGERGGAQAGRALRRPEAHDGCVRQQRISMARRARPLSVTDSAFYQSGFTLAAESPVASRFGDLNSPGGSVQDRSVDRARSSSRRCRAVPASSLRAKAIGRASGSSAFEPVTDGASLLACRRGAMRGSGARASSSRSSTTGASYPTS